MNICARCLWSPDWVSKTCCTIIHLKPSLDFKEGPTWQTCAAIPAGMLLARLKMHERQRWRKSRRSHGGGLAGGRSVQVPPNKSYVSSTGMVSSPSAPNERALEQGCNLCEQNHWPVLIGHKHVTAEVGHSSLWARTSNGGASSAALAGSATFRAAPPHDVASFFFFCSFFFLLFMWHVTTSCLPQYARKDRRERRVGWKCVPDRRGLTWGVEKKVQEKERKCSGYAHFM